MTDFVAARARGAERLVDQVAASPWPSVGMMSMSAQSARRSARRVGHAGVGLVAVGLRAVGEHGVRAVRVGVVRRRCAVVPAVVAQRGGEVRAPGRCRARSRRRRRCSRSRTGCRRRPRRCRRARRRRSWRSGRRRDRSSTFHVSGRWCRSTRRSAWSRPGSGSAVIESRSKAFHHCVALDRGRGSWMHDLVGVAGGAVGSSGGFGPLGGAALAG